MDDESARLVGLHARPGESSGEALDRAQPAIMPPWMLTIASIACVQVLCS